MLYLTVESSTPEQPVSHNLFLLDVHTQKLFSSAAAEDDSHSICSCNEYRIWNTPYSRVRSHPGGTLNSYLITLKFGFHLRLSLKVKIADHCTGDGKTTFIFYSFFLLFDSCTKKRGWMKGWRRETWRQERGNVKWERRMRTQRLKKIQLMEEFFLSHWCRKRRRHEETTGRVSILSYIISWFSAFGKKENDRNEWSKSKVRLK